MKTLRERKIAGRLCVAAMCIAILFVPKGAEQGIVAYSIQGAERDVHIQQVNASSRLKVPFPPRKPMHFKWLNIDLAFDEHIEEAYEGHKPLSGAQSNIYQQIFELQSLGEFAQANQLINKVTDRRLMGHVLSQRYLHPDYRSSYTELANWMKAYADHPEAKRVYMLAVARQPEAVSEPLRKPNLKRQLPSVRNPVIQAAKKQGHNNALWKVALKKWSKGQYEGAAADFLKVSKSGKATGWRVAAGHYWAARCYEQLDQNQAQKEALREAAAHPHTFYGLLAAESLGGNFVFQWDQPEFTQQDKALLLEHRAGKRAFALVSAGQYGLAEKELLRLPYKGHDELQRAALAYAGHVGLPALSMRLGNIVKRPEGGYYDAAMYPVTPWDPDGGYRLDPALVHAVIRQESRFDTLAVSHVGASGLMQIMPATAKYIAGKMNYNHPINSEILHRPEISIKMGQDYLQYLLDGKYVSGDVVSLLAAYNAGPGNLHKWKKRIDPAKDPLFFIESIPVTETRVYVKRVMTNYWIYSLRAGAGSPSLLALSQNRPSRYSYVLSAEYPYQLAVNR